MAFEYLTNIPLEEARQSYLENLLQRGMKPRFEIIPTNQANHRITAKAVYAKISAPHYNACAMDGIAVEAAATNNASDTHPITMPEGSYQWVNTGDPLPEGFDSVVMVEDVIENNGEVSLYAAATPWQHVRQIGEDISAGDMIVPSFSELQGATLGALLAAGVLNVEVFTKPTVAIIPTGNELVAPKENPGEGDIIEFNSTIFKSIFEDWGFRTRVLPIVQDVQSEIEDSLQEAMASADLVILNAGSSAGNKDFSTAALQEVGEVLLHGVAIKPGKPAILAVGRYEERVIPLVGLPGYPVSGILVLDRLIKPVASILSGKQAKPEKVISATISRRLTSSLKYLEFVRAQLGNVNGKLVAVPLNRGAGVVSSFVKADGIIQIPQDLEGYEAGAFVQVQLLRDLDEINQTLVITGSHDPLIDEIADMIKRKWPVSRIASSHVGSLGGIMAVKRGEAHMGGIHLLDEVTGEYNIPYLRKYFPDGGVLLMHVVQRTQGLIVAKGNPLNIRGVSDLPGINYVNRQKGSGTRILIDYLTSKFGIDPHLIKGYEREEFTHTAVAATIAAGSADAGLGIYSAAKIYDLDFLPVCEEQYDFLIAESAMELESVKQLIEVLKSEEFAQRLQKLGGYQLIQPGEVQPWH